MSETSRKHIALLVLVGLGVRLWLVFRFPVIFGGDTVLRLVNYEYIVLSYQLPALQSIVHFIHGLSPDPLWVRVAVSIIGAIAGVGFYLLAAQFVSARSAFYGALLFTLHPFLLPLSTVPYQEILMLAGLLFAFYGAFADRPLVASAGLAVACLTRYEAWLACPMIAWAYLDRRSFSLRHIAEAGALFGWAPLAWIIYNGALTPAGSFAVENRFSTARFVRWAFVGYVALRNTPWPVLLLAVIGLAIISLRQGWRDQRYLLLAAYLGVFLVVLLFSAHGTAPDPERRVTDREAHIPIVGMLLLATIGIESLRRFQASAVAVCAAISLWTSVTFLKAHTTEPRLALAVETAHYLDRAVTGDDQVAVLSHPIEGIDRYLMLTSRKGPKNRDAAIHILNTLENTPPDYQRMLVHSKLGKQRLRSYASLIVQENGREDTVVHARSMERPPAWIVRWNDFRPTNIGESQLAAEVDSLSPEWIRAEQGVEVKVYRVAGR